MGSGPLPGSTKALAQRYRAPLVARGISPLTINVRLALARKLARQMSDNGLLDLEAAAATERVPGVGR